MTGQCRTLVTPAEESPNTRDALDIPIFEEVAAGQPGWAKEHIEGYAARSQDTLDLQEVDFLLRICGDSMFGVGIYPGDPIAILPNTNEPNSGEITLVSVPSDDTATLKRWQQHNGTVSLHSANPDYPVITFKVEDV
ncbi:LexA family protein [Deinococcus altitudinis]|uniref:LexA family protein n=1 Tax=Deinococcus altitudinis TaxID=468914 RepID=UPI003892788F